MGWLGSIECFLFYVVFAAVSLFAFIEFQFAIRISAAGGGPDTLMTD
jgi:hypothetical protein